MLLMGETAAQRDLSNRFVGVFQKALGPLDATAEYELMGRKPGGDFESAREMRNTETAGLA